MSDINQVKNSIQEEFKRRSPSPIRIISSLFNLRIDKEGIEIAPKDEWRYVPQAEFFNIIGEIFNRNPEFYMKYLFMAIKKKMRKLKIGTWEMEKTIIEKYCLRPGEQILLEFGGSIEFWENPTFKSRGVMAVGTFFFTSHRIIVCPSFSIAGRGLTAKGGSISSGLSSRKRIINDSIQEKCYGYIFPTGIPNVSKLKKKSKGVNYNVKQYRGKTVNINIVVATPIGGSKAVRVSKQKEQKENVDLLFEILTLNGQKKCPQCGKINLPNDDFCKECGIELIILNSQKKCHRCGKINLPDDNFCKECGIELKAI